MKTPTKRATRRLAASLAIVTAFATGGAYAAGFWKGTGQDSGTAENWTNGQVFMDGDDFFFRDAKMTEGATYTRAMRLTADVTSSKRIFFQCGTEADPFVVDGNNHTITLEYGGDWYNSGNFYVGHSDYNDNEQSDGAGYYGSAVLNGGTWTCNQLYVGAGTAYTGYLRLNGASLTATGPEEHPLDNGKVVVDDGALSFTRGWVTIAHNGGTTEFVVNGGTVSCGHDLLFGSGSSGTLTVNGGTVTVVPERMLTAYGAGAVNLNGGTLVTSRIWNGPGGTITVNFNGGTLQANGVNNDGLIQWVTVNVNNAGGIIDNGGNNIAIAAPLIGGGRLIFTGGGTTTLSNEVSYAGKTAVTPGTILVIANETAKNTILGTRGLVVAGLPTPGQTIVTYTSALEDADLAKVSCSLAPETTFKVSDDRYSIVVDTVGPLMNYWTGAAGDYNLSTAGNWSENEVPTGSAYIFSTNNVTLAKGETFAPTSITFLEGSAGVTIGGDFTSLTKIINNSYVNQTFSGAVNFGSGNIDVVQTGVCDDNSKSVVGGCVVFAGGVTGNNITNHTVFTGNYTLTTTDKIYFTSRFVVNAGSTLTVKNTDQIQELYIMSGATFRAEYASHGWTDWIDGEGNRYGYHRLWCWNAGTFIADRYEFYGAGSEGRQWLGGYLGPYGNSVAANANGILKIGTLNINSDGVVVLHGFENDGDVADALTTYIGAGGLNIAEGKTGYYLVEDYTHSSTLRPLKSNFTFGKGSNASYDFRIGNASDSGNINFTFHTDDEQDVAREITLAARVKTEQNTSSITVKGGGTLKVTSASPDMIGSTVVADTATLAFGAGASFGAAGTAGAITLGNGTTLALTSTGKALSPLANALNLPTGAGEVATIRIDGERLASGDHEIATVGNAAATANVTIDENSTALAGRKYTLEVENGKLLLHIKFARTIVIIR